MSKVQEVDNVEVEEKVVSGENSGGYDVEEKASELPNDLKWDDLIELYKQNSELVRDGITILKEIGVNFQDIINMDKELSKAYIGATNTFLDLIKELTKILSVHSKRVELDEKSEDGTPKVQLNPFIGELSINNDKHREVYLQLVIAYSGFTEKASSGLENVLTTITGLIQEVADREGIELKENIADVIKGNKNITVSEEKEDEQPSK